jgi:hypothetical protein
MAPCHLSIGRCEDFSSPENEVHNLSCFQLHSMFWYRLTPLGLYLRPSAVYRAWKTASLFSRNAVVPSRISSVWPRS